MGILGPWCEPDGRDWFTSELGIIVNGSWVLGWAPMVIFPTIGGLGPLGSHA